MSRSSPSTVTGRAEATPLRGGAANSNGRSAAVSEASARISRGVKAVPQTKAGQAVTGIRNGASSVQVREQDGVRGAEAVATISTVVDTAAQSVQARLFRPHAVTKLTMSGALCAPPGSRKQLPMQR